MEYLFIFLYTFISVKKTLSYIHITCHACEAFELEALGVVQSFLVYHMY